MSSLGATGAVLTATTLAPGLVGAWAAARGAATGAVLAMAGVAVGMVSLHWGLPDRIGVHEVPWALWWTGVGIVVGSADGPSQRGGRLAALGLFLGVGELGARAAGWSARPEVPSLAAGVLTWPHPCLVQQMAPAPHDSVDRPRPRIVHLGDSMTQGIGPRAETFVARLDASDPRRSHLRVAMAGTGPDCALHVLRQLPTVDGVFLHVFPGNDADDIGFRYPWCGGPLVDLDAPGLPSRCPDGPVALPPWRRLWWDPAPFAWRWTAAGSALSNVLLQRLWEPIPHWLGMLPMNSGDEDLLFRRADGVLAALQAEARRRGVPFAATLLPWSGMRLDATGQQRIGMHTRRWRELLAGRGVPTLDLTDVLSDVTDPPVPGVYVSDDPPDPHYGPEGYRRVYEAMQPWVAEQLGPVR